jgi:hypothetical protein
VPEESERCYGKHRIRLDGRIAGAESLEAAAAAVVNSESAGVTDAAPAPAVALLCAS